MERDRTIMEHAADALFVYDPEGRIFDVNRRACDALGYTREELLSLSMTDLETVHLPGGVAGLWRRLAPEEPVSAEGIQRRKDGTTFPVEVRVGLLEASGRRLALSIARDITERKRTEEALRESERRFRQLFENSADAHFIHDERGRFVDCNAEACRVLGYTREELLELRVADVATHLIPEERRHEEGGTLWERTLRAEPGRIVGFDENELRRKDGSSFPVEVGVGAIEYGGRRMIFAAARDITKRKALEEQLAHQAFHDPLTGLPNRTLFMDRLEGALSRADRRGNAVAILFLDLDDFKRVNDSLGHDRGDQLLLEAGRRLDSEVRLSDTVARLGGDEFVVLLDDVRDEGEAALVADRIRKEFEAPFVLAGHEVPVTASIGVAIRISPGTESRTLLREADLAMYRAKEKGKNRYEVCDPGTSARRSG